MLVNKWWNGMELHFSNHLIFGLSGLYFFFTNKFYRCVWTNVVIHPVIAILLKLHLALLTFSVQFQTHYLSYSLQHYLAASKTLCWSKRGKIENDENGDNNDDKDGYSDNPKVLMMEADKKLPLSSRIQSHFSSGKDNCNHPFCLLSPSIFSLPCVTINLGSFILILSYFLNWQSKKRTGETNPFLNLSQTIYLCILFIFSKDNPYIPFA